ncbi:MAG: PhoH family protein [Candidatus Omnitrophota bacterium]
MEKIIKLGTYQEARGVLGSRDENIREIEKAFRVKITVRGEHLKISGAINVIKKASAVIESLLAQARSGQDVSSTDLRCLIANSKASGNKAGSLNIEGTSITRLSTGRQIGPKTPGQKDYVDAINKNDIVFGIGPAGTGKTYLAMVCAVEALRKQEVRRIILTRPAIEAGESLGFLPGDMYEKISPYLRPLYDALYDMMEAEKIEKYIETGIIEVAPLAYMRGRTLNDAFIILDEAQNCTAEQMKMFLTRLGFDSKAVITGDMTQSDLPEGKPIGLLQAEEILKDITGIKIVYFSGLDVVRHALVQNIIEAYEKTNRAK